MKSTKTKYTPEEVKQKFDEAMQLVTTREFESVVIEQDIAQTRAQCYQLALLVDSMERIDPQKGAPYGQKMDAAWKRLETIDAKAQRMRETVAEYRAMFDKAHALYEKIRQNTEKRERRKRDVKT